MPTASCILLLVAPWFAPERWLNRAESLNSPDGNVEFQLIIGARAQLSYRVLFQGHSVIDASPLGIAVDQVNLGEGVALGASRPYRINETYAWRGVHSKALNHSNGAEIDLRHAPSGARYTLEVRVCNDGVGFRFIVPGDERLRVADEASGFTIPVGSTVWYHDFEGHYEGVHHKKDISAVESGEWAAPPLLIKLPDGRGYAVLTEAALMNYAGMGLEAGGERRFAARLGHALPISYPFRLRFPAEGERLARPAAIAGTITTPWRAIVIGASLDSLVNSDLVPNLAPAPDPHWFPQGIRTDWIKPGRCVWRYLDGGGNTLEDMKEYSRLAGRLGFEYNLLEGFWTRWSESELRELVEFSNEHNVKIWLWKHRRGIGEPDERRKFFKMCHDVGVAGVKLDFFDHEAKEVIDLYQAALRDAAEFQLMVDFHGANKPAGESRTWPNEMTREGVYGLEHRRMPEWARHNTTLPFTRMIAGHADYTPVHFGERRKETSWAHQIASAAIFTSPLLIYGAHPKSLLENPAVDMIKSVPSVWDETIVLPSSEVGEVAVFARRQGNTWFLAIMNGPTGRSLQIPLSFLGTGTFQAMLVRDRPDEAAAVQLEEKKVTQAESLAIDLRAGGGFIGRFGIASP